jgi:hypothetical protein
VIYPWVQCRKTPISRDFTQYVQRALRTAPVDVVVTAPRVRPQNEERRLVEAAARYVLRYAHTFAVELR